MRIIKCMPLVVALFLSLALQGCPLFGDDGSTCRASWYPVAPMPTARGGMSAVSLGTYIYVIGGYARAGEGEGHLVQRYRPADNSWQNLNDLPIKTDNPAAAVVNGSLLLVAGGGELLEYDESLDSWSQISTLVSDLTPNTPRAAVGMDDKLYVAFQTGGGGEHQIEMHVFDTTGMSWSAGDTVSVETGAGERIDGVGFNGQLYFLGLETTPRFLFSSEQEMWRYDPVARKWHRAGFAMYALAARSMALFGSSLVLAGGYNTDLGIRGSRLVEKYDPTREAFTPASGCLVVARDEAAMVAHGEKLYIFGASGGGLSNPSASVEASAAP